MMRPASVARDPLRRHALRLAAWTSYALLACSSGKPTTQEQHDFSDASGRVCQATLDKTSPGAPAVKESVSCDGAAAQCSSESSPCFQLSIDRDSYAVRNCPACCKGTASSFAAVDCSPVVCAVDSDCVYAQAKCLNGACSCPSGYCD